jgi:hypothetical protein
VRCFSSKQPSTRISPTDRPVPPAGACIPGFIGHHDNDAITPANAHTFFAAAASVAGALIGLLFVAISVAPKRILGPEASAVHGVRAAATLTAFSNALTVSLFALIPGYTVGPPATAVAIVGLLFIVRALVSVAPAWRADEVRMRDFSFLVGQLVVFVIQLIAAVQLDGKESNRTALQLICTLVVVCFLIGIERAWELVGGPHFTIGHTLLIQRRKRHEQPPDDGKVNV